MKSSNSFSGGHLKRFLFLVLLSLPFLSIGCGTSPRIESITSEDTQTTNSQNHEIDQKRNHDDLIKKDDLKKNRQLWSEKKIANYDMIIRFKPTGFLIPASPVLIKVRDGRAIAIKPISKNDQRPIAQYTKFDTIEKMFEEFEKELDFGTEVKGGFNPEYGYPENIFVKYAGGSNAMYEVQVDKFDVVK